MIHFRLTVITYITILHKNTFKLSVKVYQLSLFTLLFLCVLIRSQLTPFTITFLFSPHCISAPFIFISFSAFHFTNKRTKKSMSIADFVTCIYFSIIQSCIWSWAYILNMHPVLWMTRKSIRPWEGLTISSGPGHNLKVY